MPGSSRSSTAPAVGSGLLAVAVLAGVAVYINRAPAYEVSGVVLDESCTLLLVEYCVRVTCTVHNGGSTTGTPKITVTLFGSNGRAIATRSTGRTVEASRSTSVVFDFQEAEVADGHLNYRAECTAL